MGDFLQKMSGFKQKMSISWNIKSYLMKMQSDEIPKLRFFPKSIFSPKSNKSEINRSVNQTVENIPLE